MTSTFDFRALFHEGGFIMTPLAACSVIATTAIVERAIALCGVARHTQREATEVLALVRRGALGARKWNLFVDELYLKSGQRVACGERENRVSN